MVIPSGRAPEYIRLNKTAFDIVQHFSQSKNRLRLSWPQLLLKAGALEGKACAAYPSVESDANLAGGKYVNIPMDKAHVDGKLVTPAVGPLILTGSPNFYECWIQKYRAIA